MVAVILGVAIILRLILINQSLWLDEAIQALALMGRMGPILKYALADFQPPLYHYVGLVWTHFAGYSEVALRFPSFLAGIGTVYFVLKIGEFVGGKKVGAIAGLLAATNPLLIYYSQEGRTYSLTAFFVTASFYYVMKLFEVKKLRVNLVTSYVFLVLCSVWSSYLAWIVIGLQLLYAVYKKRYDIAALIGVCFLTLLIWLPALRTSLSIGLSTAHTSPQWAKVVGDASLKAVALTWVKATIGRISFANKFVYAGIVGVLGVIHGSILRQTKKFPELLLIWLLGPIVLGSLFSVLVPVYSYTRVLFVVPAFLILLSLGLGKIPKVFAFLLVGVNIVFLFIFWLTPRFHREDWRALTHDLNTYGQGTAAMPSLNQDPPLTYYGLTLPLTEVKNGEKINVSPVYYIKYAEDLFDPTHVGPDNLRSQGYTNTRSVTYPGLQIDVYENHN